MKKIVLIVISILLVPVAVLVAIAFVLGLGYLTTQITNLTGQIPDNFGWTIVFLAFVVTVYISGIPEGIYNFFARLLSKNK